MCVILGKQIPRGIEAIRTIECLVDICTSEPVRLRRLAYHRAPRVNNDLSCGHTFWRKVIASPTDPIIVAINRSKDGWFSGSQGNDLGEDALKLRAEYLRCRSRTGCVVFRPVGVLTIRAIAWVIVTEPGGVVVGDVDYNNVGIGECIPPVGIGFQFFKETVDLESVKLGEVSDNYRVVSCLFDGMCVPGDETVAVGTGYWAVVCNRIANYNQKTPRRRRTGCFGCRLNRC